MEYCKYCMRPLKNGNAGFCALCGKNLSAPVPEHHLPPGTVLDRKYELGAALGEGGFGITYIARDTRLDLRVAVKEFYPYGFVSRMAAVSATVSGSANEEQKAFFEKGRVRFLQEAQTLARFSGEPGIVDVRDFFEENNTAYIVMEYLEGETLRDHLKKTGRLTPEATLLLLTPVMRSLSRLHKENLIHRDISPDNVMLTKSGVKLLDFGAARFVEGDQKSLSVMLKPGYAPEEQYRTHGQQGPWTDVYALCATMYRCITGVRPDEAIERMYEDRLQPPSRLGVAIDPAFEAALLKGLALRGADRWQTIDDLLAAIPEKPTAPPVPQPKRPDVTQTAFTPTIDVTPPPIPEKTPPQSPPIIKNEENPSEPGSPEAAAEPQKSGKRGVKIALGVAAVFVVVLVLVLVRRNTTFSGELEIDNYNVGDVVTFGTYEQDNDASNGTEEIEWQVLKKEDGRALLISKYALDCQQYNTEYSSVTWETCSLRQWLNDDFYNAAFSDSEKNRILSSTVTVNANLNYDTDFMNTLGTLLFGSDYADSKYDTNPENDATDMVFLLSVNEVNANFVDNEARQCLPTAYAAEQGVWTNDDGFCFWWLRSSVSSNSNYVTYVNDDGLVDYSYDGSYTSYGVRPAVWIDL